MPAASQQPTDSLSLPRSLKTRHTTYVLTELLVQTANANLFVGYKKSEPHVPLVFKRIPRMECTKVEADIHRSLPRDNPYVIPLLDHVTTKDYIFLVLPFYKNGDLFDLIITVHSHEGIPQDVKEEWATNVFAQMVEAVHFLHRHGVYHRDLKPENFLIDDEGRLRIADFGLATMDAKNAALGFGSEFYMGPESFSEQKELLTHRRRGSFSSVHGTPNPAKSDVWSLGILMLNLLCGRNPWSRAVGSNAAFADYMRRPAALREAFGLSESAWKLVSRMLHLNVLKRADIREVLRLFKGVDSWLAVETDTLIASENAQYYAEAQTVAQEAVVYAAIHEQDEDDEVVCADETGRRNTLCEEQLLAHYELTMAEMEHVLSIAKSATVGYADKVDRKRKPAVHVSTNKYDAPPPMVRDDDDGMHSAASSDDEPMTPPATTPVSMAEQMEALLQNPPSNPACNTTTTKKKKKGPVARLPPPPQLHPNDKPRGKKTAAKPGQAPRKMTGSWEAPAAKIGRSKPSDYYHPPPPPPPPHSPKASHAPWMRGEMPPYGNLISC